MPFWLRVVAVVECSRLCLMVFAFPAFLVLLWPAQRRTQTASDGGVFCRRVFPRTCGLQGEHPPA